jgi:S1-C subfamily serine protease
MMRQGLVVPTVTIVVAPGPLGLDITGQPEGGARIVAIKPSCPFRDEVSVGDLIMRFNNKEVKTAADFSVGLLEIRRFFIVRWSILHHTTPDGPMGIAPD